MKNLGYTYQAEGRYEDAEAILGPALEICRRALGEEHPTTMDTAGILAFCDRESKRFEEAERLSREQVEIRRRVLGAEHRETLVAQRDLAWVFSDQGRYAEAEALNRETLDISRHVLGEADGLTNGLRYNLACAVAVQDRPDEAISYLRAAVDNGYRGPPNWSSILEDPDLTSLHGDPEFEAMVAEFNRRNAEGATAESATGGE
jgi:tetratricopeptide (TPR) repeat protein